MDAAVEVEAARSRFSAVGGRRFGLRPDVDPVVEATRAGHNVRTSVLEDLDKVDALRLAEAAGTRLDLVEVLGTGRFGGVRLLTTERRARVLVGTGSSGWSLVEDEEVPA